MENKIAQKLFKLQGEIGTIKKDSTNPHFKNSYFDINKLIETIQPLLQSNGLLLTQPILNGIQYSRITDVESGAFVESGIQLPNEINPQKMGSASSYYRRYSLVGLLALQGEDDDGNKASSKRIAPAKPLMIKDSDNWNRAVNKKVPATEVIKYMTFTGNLLEEYKEAIK
jgi:hypothetical protein